MNILKKQTSVSFAIASLIFVISVMPLTSSAASKQKIQFNDMTIESPYRLTQGIIAADLLADAGKELLTISVDEDRNRWLMIYAFDVLSKQYKIKEQTIIPKHFHSFDIGEAKQALAQGKLQQIYFTSSDELFVYQAGHFKQLAKSNSIYLKEVADYLKRGDFIHDLNKI